MAMKIYQDVDFRKNKLQNIRLDPVNAFPGSPVNGQVVFREDQGAFYWYDLAATLWKPLATTVINATAPSAIDLQFDNMTGVYTIKVKIDTSFFEIDGTQNTLKIKASAIAAVSLATDAVETAKIKAKAVTFAKIQDIDSMTVIGRTAAGTGVSSQVSVDNDPTMAANSPTSLVTQAAIVAYVGSTLGTFGGYVGQYNASTAGGLLPVNPTGTKVGNWWDVSVAGTLQGIVFEPGDVILARVASASQTNVAHWVFLQKNLPESSETAKGYLRLATTSEVTAGSDDTTAVTPLKLAQKLASPGGRYTTNLGDGTTTEFTVTHGLNIPIPIVLLFDNDTSLIVYTSYEVIDLNNIKVTFGTAPTASRYTIIIKPF